MLSSLRNESENENKINQNSSVNIRVTYLNNQNMFKRLGFLTFFTKIYEVCIDMCIVSVLQDS